MPEIAITLSRLMAYKDEYEVARLYAEPAFMERLREQFDGDLKITFHLASAALFSGKDSNGRPRKRELGGWMLPLFRILARFKGLRGTAFGPFGYMAERRMERRLISDYRAMMDEVLEGVTPSTMHAAIELAGAAQEVRGYGPVKHSAFVEYEATKAGEIRLLQQLRIKRERQNYGGDKVRFITPVRVGQRIRGHFRLVGIYERRPGEWQQTIEYTVEIEGDDKPALFARWIGICCI